MIIKPQYRDVKVICYYLGKIILGVGLCMLVPFATALFSKEWNPSLDFAIGMMGSFAFGFLFIRLFYTKETLDWSHGMIIASLSWVAAMLVSAIPLVLSGHYLNFLDACFETMSGFTTSGLTLVQDLDHLSDAHNIWRHFMQFIGGQGMVVFAITFLIKASGSFSLYVGEAKDEKLLPNIISTSRFIWLISIVYMFIGTLILTFACLYDGLPPAKSLFHGLCLFFAAWSTGGFTVNSQSVLYYHSILVEIATISILFLGVLNFKLHHAVWTGNRKEIFKNIEMVAFLSSIFALFSLCAVGLARMGVYPDAVSVFRKGFYCLISGHSTTGFGTIYARQFINEWGGIAVIAIIIAMALGGCACSTAGGIKALRVGIIFKALRQDIKRFLVPEDAVIIQKFHHIKELILEDKHLRPAAIISLCFILLYVAGAVIGMLLGYTPLQALFESVSAASNTGLSSGITSASMPATLKIIYIFQMWIGRLEFMSVFALFGFALAFIKGK